MRAWICVFLLVLFNAHAVAPCNLSVVVDSPPALEDALECAQNKETTEIILEETVYVSQVVINDVTNLTIRGTTLQAGLRYQDLVSRRLLVVNSSTVTISDLSLMGDHAAGCVLAVESHVTFRNVRVISLPYTYSVQHNSGLGILLKNSSTIVDGSTISGWMFAENGAAISAQMSSNVTVFDTEISENVVTGNGGGIHISSSSNIYVSEGCKFTSNSAAGKGGAIFVSVDSATIFTNIAGSFFKNNSAIQGGAIHIEASANLALAPSFSLSSLIISKNYANYGGGINVMAHGTLFNISFDSNVATETGGGFVIAHGSTVDASNIHILNNAASSDDEDAVGAGGGGVIWQHGSFICSSCRFVGNTADKGGGVLAFGFRSKLYLDSSTFINNTADTGGAVAMERGHETNITQCEFFNNAANTAGGSIFVFDSKSLLLSSTLLQGSRSTGTQTHGGTLAVDSCRIAVKNVTMVDSSAGFGGCIHMQHTFATVEETTMLECYASSQGGAMEILSVSEATIRGSTFQNAFARQSGGGVFASSSCMVSVFDSSFENTTTLANGGSIYAEYDTYIKVGNSTFARCEAVDGGAIFFDHESFCSVESSLFYSNYALNGGAIALRSSEVTSYNNIYEQNVAHIGGSLAVSTESRGYFRGDVFLNCSVKDSGGGVHVESNSYINVTGCSFLKCSANYGGGINSGGVSQIDVMHSVFVENRAGLGGGAIRVESSVHAGLINVTFRDNLSQRGGAVVLGNTKLTVVDSTCHRCLGLYGGCLYTEDFSYVSIQNSKFLDSSSFLGGALYLVMSEANITSSLFAGNFGFESNSDLINLDPAYATFTGESSTGGAITTSLSVVRLIDCVAHHNRARHGGFAQLRYSVMESRNSTYFNNSATAGGLLHANAKCQVSFFRDRFQRNVADSNGALVWGVDFGEVLFRSVTIDASNSFSNSPTSLIFLSDGNFVLSSCYFFNPLNTTRSTTLDLLRVDFRLEDSFFWGFYGNDVGAIVRVSHGIHTVIRGTVFGENFADYYGGALAFRQSNNVTITNCTFSANSAMISGGAIYSEDSSLYIRESTFENNEAKIGGGCVYWTRSTLVFQNNTTGKSNKALYGPDLASVAQELVVNNVHEYVKPQSSGDKLSTPIIVVMHDYYGQIVRAGDSSDSKSLVITASTTDKNSSISGSTIEVFDPSDGNAIFDDLTVTLAPGSSVGLNFEAQGDSGIKSATMGLQLRECVVGEIKNQLSSTQSKCEVCPVGTYSFDPMDKSCSLCPRDATCSGGASISPDKGFWRQCQECEDIEECIYHDVCLGGPNVSSQCRTGNEGPLCNVCVDGYSRNVQGGCDKCGSIGVVVHTIIGLSFGTLFLLLVLAYIFRKIIIRKLGTYFHKFEERLDRMNWNKHRTKVKIMIAFIQITSGIPALLSVDFHPSFNSFVDILGYLTLGFFQTINLECYFTYNFYTRMRVSTLVPPIFMLLIDTTLKLKSFMAIRANSVSPSYSYKIRNIDRKRYFLYISFFVFSGISTQVFQTFVCEEFEDGKSYLVVDSNLECYTAEHKRNMAYAGVMIFFYPVGIPLYYAYHLYRKKKYINPPSSKVVLESEKHIVSDDVIQAEKIKLRKTYKVLDGQQFLFDSYLPKCWFFEIVECFRRLSLTALPILFLRNSIIQIILVLLISLGFCALYMTLHPFELKSDNTVAILSQWAVSMTVIGALCMKINSTSQNEEEFDSEGVSIILIIVNSMIFVFTVYASAQESDLSDEMGDINDEMLRESSVAKNNSARAALEDSDDDTIDDEQRNRTIANVNHLTSLDAFEKGVKQNRRVSMKMEEEKRLEAMEEAKKLKRQRRASQASCRYDSDDENNVHVEAETSNPIIRNRRQSTQSRRGSTSSAMSPDDRRHSVKPSRRGSTSSAMSHEDRRQSMKLATRRGSTSSTMSPDDRRHSMRPVSVSRRGSTTDQHSSSTNCTPFAASEQESNDPSRRQSCDPAVVKVLEMHNVKSSRYADSDDEISDEDSN